MQRKGNASGKGLTTKHIILIFGALVIICAAVIVALILLREPAEDTAAITDGAKVVDQSNLSSLDSEAKDKVAKGMFETHMNTTWKFADGKSASSNAVMGNSASNNYAFWFTVALKDTSEIVYTSSILPVGTQLDTIKLDKELKKGTYAAVVSLHMVDEKGSDTDHNMGFNITLIIEN